MSVSTAPVRSGAWLGCRARRCALAYAAPWRNSVFNLGRTLMNSDQLRAVLRDWPLPDASAARERTIARAQATTRERQAARRPLLPRLTLAATLIAVLVA